MIKTKLLLSTTSTSEELMSDWWCNSDHREVAASEDKEVIKTSAQVSDLCRSWERNCQLAIVRVIPLWIVPQVKGTGH